MKRVNGVRIEDPCAYCGRPLERVRLEGCGSEELGTNPEQRAAVAKWCNVPVFAHLGR